jgi:hypothetical protein
LLQNDVTLLCDVRKNAYSQKFGFTKNELEAMLARAGIEYVFTFHYTFTDSTGRKSCLQILDWKVYQLCRSKIMQKYGNRREIVQYHLSKKYFEDFKNRDVHFFLGTTKYWHIRRNKNPFTIVGIFYPPKSE